MLILNSFKSMTKKIKKIIPLKRLCLGIILCCLITGVRANLITSAFNQRFDVELSLKNIPLKSVVNELKKQTDIVFSYDTSIESLRVNDVSVKAQNEEIETILNKVFKDTGITYKIEDRIVVLYAENSKSAIANTKQQDTKKITGRITDATGEPIIGANVLVKGTTIGTITDLDGNFVLETPQNAILSISYIGYLPEEITIGNRTTINVALKEDTKALDEVVVIGYGKMKKGDLSAAVATVANVDKLLDRPITSPEEMLQGQIPGVTITSNGGHPDARPTMTIRGMGSRSGEEPLYVVDGVPGAPFNMSDVESITVLKDAASAAIYGAYAGSAGVILVTTKQAAPGRTTVDYSIVTGISQASNLPQSLTIEEQRRVREFAYQDANLSLPPGWDVSKNPYIGETRTDWIDEIFRTAPFQRHNVAISGGTEDFSNRASFEYSDRQGTLINTHNKSVTARLNSMWKINKYIRIREDLSWQNIDKRGTNTSSAESGVILSALMMPRNAEVYNSDGSYGGTAPSDKQYIDKYGSNYADIHGDVVNPVRTLKADYLENNRSTLTSSTFLDIMEPIKGLNFTSRFTYKLESYFLRTFTPRRLEPGKPFDRNELTYESSRAPNWEFENTLNYDRVIKRHNVGVMLSTTANEYSYRQFEITGRDFGNEEQSLMYFAQAGTYDPAKDRFEKDRNVSFVGRLSYSYADRYFITGSWRRDYAGRLPKGHQYGDFPSVTGAWKITSEPFMPKTDILNTLKLRASWGRIGNLGSINYASGYPVLSNYFSGGGDIGGQVGAETPIAIGKYVERAFNPTLTWETSEQLDLGIDASLFRNRLNITADYFQKRTMNLIREQDALWPTVMGFKPPYINEGEIRNKGFEVSVNWADQVGKVNYWVSGNLATLKNEVYNIGSANEKGEKPVWTDGATYKNLNPFRSKEGEPIYSFYLIQTDGVFNSQAEIDSYLNKEGKPIQPNAKIGDLKFIDLNGDGKISDDDREFMGNAMPKLTYSLSGGFSWNNFNFSMMLQGVGGVKLFNAYKHTTLNEALSNFNRSREILKALDGPNKDVPRISLKDPNGNFTNVSDYYLEKGDYLRIKNISIGYSFTKLLHKAGYFADRKSTLDLTFSIENLATFTSYSGIDPEIGSTPASSTGSKPEAPVYSFGMDRGQYPASRTYSVALKLKF